MAAAATWPLRCSAYAGGLTRGGQALLLCTACCRLHLSLCTVLLWHVRAHPGAVAFQLCVGSLPGGPMPQLCCPCPAPLLLSLRDWKQLELFEREAQILKNLSQPGIPQASAAAGCCCLGCACCCRLLLAQVARDSLLVAACRCRHIVLPELLVLPLLKPLPSRSPLTRSTSSTLSRTRSRTVPLCWCRWGLLPGVRQLCWAGAGLLQPARARAAMPSHQVCVSITPCCCPVWHRSWPRASRWQTWWPLAGGPMRLRCGHGLLSASAGLALQGDSTGWLSTGWLALRLLPGRETCLPSCQKQVTRIALELLDILGYLGSRRPPVIHR